jgi:cobalt-zinc-cadmium efflux system membrane fusion protein
MSFLKGWLVNISVLGSLAFIAFWGHESDWTFTRLSHHTASAHESHADHAADTNTVSTQHENLIQNVSHAKSVTLDTIEDLEVSGIRVTRPLVRSMEESISAPGVITYIPSKTAQLTARVPGTVWKVECEVGDQVHKGDVLLILDANEVGQAKADFLKAMVIADLKQVTAKRLEAARESVPDRVLLEAQTNLREALVCRFNAQQRLINLGLPVHYEDFADLTDLERLQKLQFVGIPDSLVQKLERDETTANLIPVLAPFDGVVIHKEIVVGEVVTPERTQLSIADVSSMRLKLSVNKEDSMRLGLNQSVDFECEGFHGKIESTIDWISTSTDEKTRSVQVLATLKNPRMDDHSHKKSLYLLKSNMFGMGHIRVREQPQALMIPAESVIFNGQDYVVYVASKTTEMTPANEEESEHATDVWSFEERNVKLGMRQSGFTEIVTGLIKDDCVVTDGTLMLKSILAKSFVQNMPPNQYGELAK